MPVYEYHCSTCGRSFEHLARSMNSREKVACPHCGGAEVERQMSVFAARQQGSAPTCAGDECPAAMGCPCRQDGGGCCGH